MILKDWCYYCYLICDIIRCISWQFSVSIAIPMDLVEVVVAWSAIHFNPIFGCIVISNEIDKHFSRLWLFRTKWMDGKLLFITRLRIHSGFQDFNEHMKHIMIGKRYHYHFHYIVYGCIEQMKLLLLKYHWQSRNTLSMKV